MVVGDVVALVVDVRQQHLVALERFAGGVLARVVVLHREKLETRAARLVIDIIVEGARHAGLREDGVDPVDHAGALLDPHADDALVALARGVARELVEQAPFVHMRAGCLGVLCVDGAEPVAAALDGAGLLAQHEVDAQIGGRGGCGHPAVSCADDQQVGLLRLLDVAGGDVGRAAQPVGFGGCVGLGFGGVGFRRVAGRLGFGLRGASGQAERRERTRGCGARQEASTRKTLFCDVLHDCSLL